MHLNEFDYKKLLIEMVTLGDYDDKDEVVSLLKMCNVAFNKTSEYTRGLVWNQCNEYIYITIIPDRLLQLKHHSDYIKKLCFEIYPNSEEYALADILFKPGTIFDYENISPEVLFEGIQKQIIEEIRAAKYVIWIAMAWFTDPVLYRELLKQKRKGLTIEIVVDDNSKNRNAEFDLNEEFSTHWITIESLYKNIMHDKFCIIDFSTVVHGTFNWTKAANYNKETISIDRNRSTAETFADEFMKLKKSDLC